MGGRWDGEGSIEGYKKTPYGKESGKCGRAGDMGSVSYPTPLVLSLSQLSYIESGTMLLSACEVVSVAQP